jgi:large subunit ribosomal protein L25
MIELIVQKREILGKQVKSLRQKGLVPAELYGKGVKNLHLTIPLKDFTKAFKQAGESSLVHIVVGGNRHPTMISDVERDPLTDEILSVDLRQVKLDEKLRVKVPFEFIGVSAAVKEKSGILVKAMHEIEVEALAGNIPRSLAVQLEGLREIGHSVYVKNLSFPEGVRPLVTAETAIVTVTPQMTEEEEKALAAEVAPEAVVVETEEKKAERLAKGAEKTQSSSPSAAPGPAKK